MLAVLHALIAHARSFAATAAARAVAPEFATVAAVFGTYELPVILHRVQLGILRAVALQNYLLDRAARGRNLRFAWPPRAALRPHHRAPCGACADQTARPRDTRLRRPGRIPPANAGRTRSLGAAPPRRPQHCL